MKFPKYTRFIKPKRRVTKVYVHCSAHDGESTDNAATMNRWHKERGWNGIGYHFFIRFDGTIEHGRSIAKTPSAQKWHNRGTIAICCHGGQDLKPDAFTPEQFDSLRRLCADIDKAYGGKITFHGHKEVSRKACPVYDYRDVLSLDKKGYMKKGVVNVPKLESAGSKTIKATKSNDDAGTAVIGIGAAGGAAEALTKLKGVSENFGEWRSVIDAISNSAIWLVSHWWLALLAAGGVIIWNNRKIIRARISDEAKIGRLAND